MCRWIRHVVVVAVLLAFVLLSSLRSVRLRPIASGAGTRALDGSSSLDKRPKAKRKKKKPSVTAAGTSSLNGSSSFADERPSAQQAMLWKCGPLELPFDALHCNATKENINATESRMKRVLRQEEGQERNRGVRNRAGLNILFTRPIGMGRRKSNHIHIFGLYSSGTNSLQSTLFHGLSDTSVCPDTNIHTTATHERTCHGRQQSKHSNPDVVLPFLQTTRRSDVKAVFIVRSPFSWLRSLLRPPVLYFKPCIRGGLGNSGWLLNHTGWWFNHSCSCRDLLRCCSDDMLCPRPGPKDPYDSVFTNLVDVWKHYTMGYLHIILLGKVEFPSERRYALISFRDLVVEPECTMNSISTQLSLPRSGVNAVKLEAKNHHKSNHIAHHSHEALVADLEGRRYMDYFEKGHVEAVCEQILAGFPQELIGLLKDCNETTEML